MKEQLLQVLREARPDVDFEKEERLIDDHILDSFDIIQVVLGINEAFDIDVQVDDLEPENFNSIQAMLELIGKLKSA